MTEMSEDERYLRELNFEQERWVLGGQQWYTAAELAKLLAISDEGVRKLGSMGKIPGAVLHGRNRIGWRFPRAGVISYLAGLHRDRGEPHQRNTTA